MPFGISTAPQCFSKIMKAAIEDIIKNSEARIVIYADDILILHQNKEILLRETRKIKLRLEEIGWLISEEKSCLEPKLIFQYLGWEWDSNQMEMKLSQEKLKKMKSALATTIKKVINKETIAIKDWASIIGKLVSLTAQFKLGGLKLMDCNQQKTKAVKKWKWEGYFKPKTSCLMELRWW
jgi:hypothetical protein